MTGSNPLDEQLNNFLLTLVATEYETFFQLMQLNSKAAIFAKSDEIEIKKNITKILKKEIPLLAAEKKQSLTQCENILDSAYRYFIDNRQTTLCDSVRYFLAAYGKTNAHE